MNDLHTPRAVRARRRRRIAATVSVLALAVVAALAVQQSLSAAFAETAPIVAPATTGSDPEPHAPTGSVLAPSEADGVIRDGDQPTVFDVDRVAVGNLDPALLDALQRAASDAEADGVTFLVNSGWRSAALQEQLLRDAIDDYGSEEEARRWVATAETSAHVSGDAVDLGPLPTLDWLTQRGWRYGLCQTYGNESWHYELRPEAVEDGCPAPYADPTEDPRMQR
ncbi:MULTISPECIES: M15 family metallopeptidase [unclassified Microbacterium]|uniref:M15 family metallopeptidase n=1 Tax=unclassified Microbacterium TaxID=2609290 RepID=UPI0025FD0A88|nr:MULTISPECIES: M15 family metallopeptidase [unclassified Microbacterium]